MYVMKVVCMTNAVRLKPLKWANAKQMPRVLILRSPTTALGTLIMSVMVSCVKVRLIVLDKLGLKRSCSSGNELVLRKLCYVFFGLA